MTIDNHFTVEPSAELDVDKVLRPQSFSDFAGQPLLLENLSIFVQAAKMRAEPLDHVLLHGPPGLGKTTLAHIVASEMGVQLHLTSGPILDKPGDLAGILTKLQRNDILFIDEIHRLSPLIEEYLYSAMEDYSIDILIDSGPNTRTIQIPLQPFTLIGATTRSGMLTAPLRARFGINARLEYYTVETLSHIIDRSAHLLQISMEEKAGFELARRSRGTPRIANALLRRVRDFAQIKGNGSIDFLITEIALKALQVDKNGLDEMDNRLLRALIERFKGGPVGLKTLANAIGENEGTLEDVYEPYLLQEGFLLRTAKGRKVTAKTYQHFGIVEMPNINEPVLFNLFEKL
jgi:Holliday junction DNA helicase RuvB